MSVLRDLWAFSFLRLAGSESVLDFPFLACCHIREGPPSFCSLFALSQCRIRRPFLPAPRCCTAATSGPQAKMLNYSFVPESTVPGKDVNSAKNPPPFPPPTTVFGVFLSAANTGKHKGDNALISLEKCTSPWAPHLKGIKVTWNMFSHVPRSPIGRRQDSGHVRR